MQVGTGATQAGPGWLAVWWLPAFAALALAAAAGATAAAPTYLSPDSLHYLDVARCLGQGRGLVSYHLHLDSPAVPAATGLWPGGFPAALAAMGSMGLEEERAPAVLNAVSLVLLALALWWLAHLAALPARLATLTTAAAMAHPAVSHVLTHTWSEPLFVALTCASLALLAHGLVRRRLVAALAAGLCAGLAFSVRYAGLFLVGHLLAATLAFGLAQRWRLRRHLVHLGLLLAGPLLTLPLAVGANLATYGRPFGLPRIPLADLGRGLLDRTQELSGGIELLVGGWGTLLLLAVVMLPSPVGQPEDVEAPMAPGGWTGGPRRQVLVLAASWIPWYLTALVASVATILTDPLDLRLLSPVAPVLVLSGFLVAAPAAARLRSGRLLAAAGVAVALLIHLDGALVRRLDPPRPPVGAELAAAASRRGAPTTLFVASQGWDLRSASGVVVLEDGYPDMRPLDGPSVFAFLDGPGRPFQRVVLVFGPSGSMPTERIPDFLQAAGGAGWAREASSAVGEMMLVELRRAAATP